MNMQKLYFLKLLFCGSLFKESMSEVVRLPKHLEPKHYDLTIIPDFDSAEFSFKGHVVIQFRCLEDSNNITLHSKGLKITNSTLVNGSIGISIEDEEVVKKTEDKSIEVSSILVFKTKEVLMKGSMYNLSIEYDSDNEENRFYAGEYDNEKFYYTMIKLIPKYNELVFDKFYETPNMSTYSMAFYVSELSSKGPVQKPSANFTMWGQEKNLGDDNKMLEKAADTYEKLQQYLNVSLPIKKQDLVVADFDYFQYTWGQINFVHHEMYIGKSISPYFNERNIINMGVKLGHQWFGNLNEIENIWQKFSYDVLQDMLQKDSNVKDSSPLRNKNSDVVISPPYFPILTKKGACLVRMINKTFGEHVFKKGFQEYLNNFSLKNVQQEDLWNSLQKFVKDIDVKSVMDEWTTQAGYPLVTVRVHEKGRCMAIIQKQFLDTKENNSTQLWKIPLSYKLINITDQTFVGSNLTHIDNVTTTKIHDHLIGQNTIVIANYEILGFFRVNYDKKNWDKIIKQLHYDHEIIDVLNRAQLIDDSFSLVGPDIEEYTLPIRISSYLVKEEQPLPWETFFKHLLLFYGNIIRYNQESSFMLFLGNLTSPIYKSVNYSQLENITSSMKFDLNVNVATWACLSGNPACNQWAIETFNQWRNAIESGKPPRQIIVDSFLPIVACSAIAAADNDTLDFLLQHEDTIYVIEDAISCVQTEEQVYRILEHTKDQLLYFFQVLRQNYVGREVMRNVLRNITTDRGTLLGKYEIYQHLTFALENSKNEQEFNKTERLFLSIIDWPQITNSTYDPVFEIKSLEKYIENKKINWKTKVEIEEKVIQALQNNE
ncbi:ANPEP [Lepeophtheirus salmonis]|uniref:ANPEP n=2 Tax=Lepeophtheirus salmonis TaxID=72036 RepID=A0A7R8HE46_LEPSM|nr:ANPEP [Lepeophtheirus salmonis]CAF3041845.1 ANPEP [Lepeophtheirus salmonis]